MTINRSQKTAARGAALSTALGAVLMLGTATVAQAQTKLLFNSFLAPQHPITTRMIKPWADEVAKVTGGRVTIELAPASLAAPNAQMDAVVKGVVDAAYIFNAFLPGKVVLPQIAQLPFVNSSAKASSIALWRTYEKHFAKAGEFNNVELLSLWVLPGGPLYGLKGPVRSPADVKGVKFYALPGSAARVLEAGGAGVVAVAAARSYEIISGGTVDAFAGYPVQDALAFHTLEYVKAITDVPGQMTAPSFSLFINKKRWQKIAPADREAITRISGEAFAARAAVFDDIEADVRRQAAAKGVQFVKADAAFVEALQQWGAPLRKEWLDAAAKRGVDGAAALKTYLEESGAGAR